MNERAPFEFVDFMALIHHLVYRDVMIRLPIWCTVFVLK